jgi:hypothetical protein
MLKIRIVKPKLKEVGQFSQASFAGNHDVPEGRDCEDCETSATQSRVIGEVKTNVQVQKEQTEPFQKAVKKNYRKMKMRLTATGPNKYNVGGKMEKPPTTRSKSAPVGFGGSLEEEKIEEKKKKPCKKAKGKKYVKRVDGKCRSFGQAGKAKDGGDRIRPGTKKGDAYCARSFKIKKCKNPPCANDLSRKKWKCRGPKSIAEEKNEKPS